MMTMTITIMMTIIIVLIENNCSSKFLGYTDACSMLPEEEIFKLIKFYRSSMGAFCDGMHALS